MWSGFVHSPLISRSFTHSQNAMSIIVDEVTEFEEPSNLGHVDALSGAPSPARPTRMTNPLALFKSGSFPFFLENVVPTGAVATNAAWSPLSWAACRRGKFYPVSGPTGEGETLLTSLVQQQRSIANKSSFRNRESLTDAGFRSLLSDPETANIVSAFWNGEYDRKATVELVAAFAPEAELNKIKIRGSLDHITKAQAVAFLTGYRVPLLVFDDMEALARAMSEGTYVKRADLATCADTYVESYLLCSDEALLAKGKVPPQEESPPVDEAKVQAPMVPPAPKPLSNEQLQTHIASLEATLRRNEAEREELERADRQQADAAAAYGVLTAKLKALEKAVAESQTQRSIDARVRSSLLPASVPPPVLPFSHITPPVMRPVDEFFLRTMADISSNMKSVADRAAAAQPGTTPSPYEKRVKLLDDILSVWGYVPFADYDVDSLKELQTRLPSRKSKAFKLVGGELRVNEDDDVADSESQHMGHWKQGCQFVLARMLKHPNARVSSEEVVTDRIAFFQEVNELAISNGSLKLKTINEFLRRMAVLKAELWMPEFEKNHLLFTKALLTDTGAHISNKRKKQDRQNEGANKKQKQIHANADSPNKRKQQATGYLGKNPLVEFSVTERVANGVCPSRKTKGQACPCKGPPRFCKFTHECPRHPGEFHAASECNKI